MNELISEWWTAAVATPVGAAVVWVGRRVISLDREKADRAELTRVMEIIEKRDDEARRSRKELHNKIEDYMKTQNAINLRLAKHMENGSH